MDHTSVVQLWHAVSASLSRPLIAAFRADHQDGADQGGGDSRAALILACLFSCILFLVMARSFTRYMSADGKNVRNYLQKSGRRRVTTDGHGSEKQKADINREGAKAGSGGEIRRLKAESRK